MLLRILWSFIGTFVTTVRLRQSRGPLRPSWSLTFEWIVRYLRHDWETSGALPFARYRRELDARPYPQTMVRKVATRDEPLGGVPARWFVPPNASSERVVLFFHGGSFIYGSARSTHADFIARLALASNVTVIALEYRLAPEHPFPAPLEDALAAFDALLDAGKKETEIVLAGDSAGGNLALELQLALRDRGGPQASRTVLVSPWSDLTMPGKSFVENDPFDYGTRATLVRHAEAYAGGVELDDPRLSPLQAKLEGLAPVLVIAGEVEIPRDDILALARRLEDANVDVTLHVAKDMPHNPPVFAAYHPNGQAALEAAASFVTRTVRGP